MILTIASSVTLESSRLFRKTSIKSRRAVKMANLNLPSSTIDKLLQVRGGAVSLGGISAMPFSLSQLKLVLQVVLESLQVLPIFVLITRNVFFT